MDYLKLVLQWISSIAWPFVVLVLVLSYRRQLGSILSNLSGIAERVGKEPVDIALGEKFRMRFGDAVRKVEEQAERLLPKGTPGVDMPPYEVLRTPVGETPLPPNYSRPGKPLPPPPGFQEHFHTLAEISARAAILEAWTEVELAVQGLPQSRSRGGPPGSGVMLSPPLVVRQLAEDKIIDSGTFAIFEELRQLRNQAAHAPNFQPSAQHAKEYVDLALRLATRFRALPYSPVNDTPGERS